jgi:GNAT superfamily N-acetyltransferase
MIESSVPAGLAIRSARLDDVGAITELIAACEVADDGAAEIDSTDVAQDLDAATGPDDAIVVHDSDRLIAWGALTGERAHVDVHPDWRGRGVGSALLRWSEQRARAAGKALVRQTVTDNDRSAAELFRMHGYEPAHTAWILEIELGIQPPDVPLPEGISIRSYRPGDEQVVHRLIDDAFSEWDGREPLPFDAWVAFATGHRAFAPDLSRLAFEDGDLVGVALAFDYRTTGDGWVQQLATKATHRHRGIARALLASVFAAFHARGRRMVGLSTDSRTGALTLYERLGMRIRRSYTGWARNLD